MPDPPVVIEHYRSLMERLSLDFQCHVVELHAIGFGIPRVGLPRLDIDTVAQSLISFLETMNLHNVTLVGTCLSGFAARAAARMAGNRVRRVVLFQTPAWDDGQARLSRCDAKRLLRAPWLGQIAFQALARRRTRDCSVLPWPIQFMLKRWEI